MKEDKPIGLYIHIPFCAGKCPYCDFYSLSADENTMDKYTTAVLKTIQFWSKKLNRPFDTLYFGGGTPSILGADRLSKIVKETIADFKCESNSAIEITVECNPFNAGALNAEFNFDILASAGVNRISLGLQSAIDTERAALGRKGTAADAARAIERAKNAGITNISLDLMLGIPGQTIERLKRSVDFCAVSGITHVSAYMLKIEDGTPFSAQKDTLRLPTEDEYCEFYLMACSELEKSGFLQYEISNFAQKGFESKHNLKYWNDEEYLGIGPAAHSFIDGKRFYYERELDSFMKLCEPIQDGEGGDFEEYAMLRFRLNEGLLERETLDRYDFGIPKQMREQAKIFEAQGLLISNVKGICFTPKGFLLSNKIIVDLLNS